MTSTAVNFLNRLKLNLPCKFICSINSLTTSFIFNFFHSSILSNSCSLLTFSYLRSSIWFEWTTLPKSCLQERTPAPFDSSSLLLQGLVTGHIKPPVKTVLDSRELQPWMRAWISIVGSYKGSNSHWYGCNTALSAPPSPVAVKHHAPVTSSPRQITPHSDPSYSVS